MEGILWFSVQAVAATGIAYFFYNSCNWLFETFNTLSAYAQEAQKIQKYISDQGSLFLTDIGIEPSTTIKASERNIPLVIRRTSNVLQILAPHIKNFNAFMQDPFTEKHLQVLKRVALSYFKNKLLAPLLQNIDPSAKIIIDHCIHLISDEKIKNPDEIFQKIKRILSKQPIKIDGFTLPKGLFSQQKGDEKTLEEIYQEYNDLPKHPLSNKDHRNLSLGEIISQQVALSEELLSLKFIYNLAPFVALFIPSFETLIDKTIHELGHCLKGDLYSSSKVFKNILINELEANKKNSWLGKFFLRHILLPSIISQIPIHTKQITEALFGHLHCNVIDSEEHKTLPTSYSSFLQKLQLIFNKYAFALKNKEARHIDPMDNRTFPQYLFEAVNGTKTQRDERNKLIAKTFINSCKFRCIRLSAPFKKGQEALLKATLLLKKEHFLNKFLKTLFTLARKLLHIFDTLIVKPIERVLNLLVNHLITHFAVKTNFIGEITHQALVLLSGEGEEIKTELLDSLFLNLLNKINKALLNQIKKSPSESLPPLPSIPLFTGKKEIKDFLRSFFELINLHQNSTSPTLEQRCEEIPFGIGGEVFEKSLDFLAPLLSTFYEKLISKEWTQYALSHALTSLNQYLIHGKKSPSTKEEKQRVDENFIERRKRIELAIKTTGQRLITLAYKAMDEQSSDSIEKTSKDVQLQLLKKLSDTTCRINQCLNDSEQSNYSTEDKGAKLGFIEESLDDYADQIIKFSADSEKINTHLYSTLCTLLIELKQLKSKVIHLREVFAASLAPPSCKALIDLIEHLDLSNPHFFSHLESIQPLDESITYHEIHYTLIKQLQLIKKILTRKMAKDSQKKCEEILKDLKAQAFTYKAFLSLKNESVDIKKFSQNCIRKLDGLKGTLAQVEFYPSIELKTGSYKLVSKGAKALSPLVNGWFFKQMISLFELIKSPPLSQAVLDIIIVPALMFSEKSPSQAHFHSKL